jgi:translocation and assembly module TamB
VLSRGCWASGNARMCGQGDRTPTGVRGVLEIDDLAFAYFRRLLPPDTRIHGSLDARAEFNQLAQGRATAKLRLQTTAGRVAKMVNARAATLEIGARAAPIAETVQASNLLEFRPSAIRFNMSERGLRFGAALRLAQGGNIKITADVPDNSEPLTRRPLRGHIDANMPDLSFISRLAPDVGRFEGRLQGDMRLSGSLRAPALHGRLAMTDGFAALYGLGLRLNDISLALVGQGSDALKLTANTHSGGGRLDVDGQLRWAGKNTPRAQFSIEGHEFLAINTMDARVFVSPDLEIEGRMGRVNVTGQLHVPRANITPKELPESAISVSADQVILPPGDEDEQAAEIAGLEVSARVRLILGDEVVDEIGEQITDKLDQPGVYIDAFGLTADIAGELLIIEEPGEPTRGSGELNIVDGRYEAYGQDLIIETGRILFPGGPISEPGVDVRAVRGDLEDADVVVGAQVRGSLKSPKFELFSEPSMSQQEQLSYLVLGRAPGASSGGESSLLARAALALGLKGGNYLAENLGSRLGVDEIGFESSERGTGDGEQASLVIGKYLSPKLYISYGIGLLEPVSTVRLEYSITKSLELVTESSGTQTGGDLIYTIERGQ